MKTSTIALCLCIFYFFLPLQCFIIGDNVGWGLQGAVFRYQMTTRGNSLIPITSEVTYVTGDMYHGRSAMSVIFWVLGTGILTILTILSLINWDRVSSHHFLLIILGMAGAAISYLVSCFFMYGVSLSGPAGQSLPFGVIFLIFFSFFLYYYRSIFLFADKKSIQNTFYD